MEPKTARQVKWTVAIVGTAALLFLLYWKGLGAPLRAIQVIVCVLACTAVLLQSGKGGGLGALGGMSDQSVFGAHSNAALRHATYFLLGMFMLGALLLVKLPQARVAASPSAPVVPSVPTLPAKEADTAPAPKTPATEQPTKKADDSK